MGEKYGRKVWEKRMGEKYGRNVWEKSMGEKYGRKVWEKSMGEKYGRKLDKLRKLWDIKSFDGYRLIFKIEMLLTIFLEVCSVQGYMYNSSIIREHHYIWLNSCFWGVKVTVNKVCTKGYIVWVNIWLQHFNGDQRTLSLCCIIRTLTDWL